MNLNVGLTRSANAVTSWQESGENLPVFCYLMIRGRFVSLRGPA